MNWQKLGFDWNQVRALVAVADLGSFSAAAKALGLTQPTVGRQVTALEQDLGLVLLERTGRSPVLTEAGRQVVEAARPMAEAGLRLSLVASGQAQDVAGPVSISASDMFAHYVLPPLIRHLHAIAPGLDIELISSNSLSDLKRREADIAIRHVRPADPDLISRLLREATAHLYAARSFLDQAGRPARVADLTGQPFVAFGNKAEMVRYLAMLGITIAERDIRTSSANGAVAWEAVRKGAGYGFMAVDFIPFAPEVEAVLPDQIKVTFPIWLVTHRELHTSPRIRLVFDVLAKALSTRP
ncbi:LysR family transcriptional regulator [Microvirga tunisiensis]|uniref:LysR family transcriptional regulator n=2 Tax=Pannonibacter tanglangensis TaxID=2750084 RepID=A0ABW9ZDZ0_9HYPH|nr:MULTISPECIES: LysR family transcriptional regulator [unclassified Pannonibacter]NBN63049.1 LysR family transcriptional regulator [Pannonibacter sp. XCT-34]NBN78623.1 LysR family transcriptional regulator [Pannonibacter sp. XCT-53]